MVRDPITCTRCGIKGHRESSYKCELNETKKRKRKPRKNSTKAWPAEERTPQKTTRKAILQDSLDMVTRRHQFAAHREHSISTKKEYSKEDDSQEEKELSHLWCHVSVSLSKL